MTLFMSLVRYCWEKCKSRDNLSTPLFLRREICYCDTKCLPVTGNFYLWQEIFSCVRKFLPLAQSFFHQISFCCRKIPEIFNSYDLKSQEKCPFLSCLKIVKKKLSVDPEQSPGRVVCLPLCPVLQRSRSGNTTAHCRHCSNTNETNLGLKMRDK